MLHLILKLDAIPRQLHVSLTSNKYKKQKKISKKTLRGRDTHLEFSVSLVRHPHPGAAHPLAIREGPPPVTHSPLELPVVERAVAVSRQGLAVGLVSVEVPVDGVLRCCADTAARAGRGEDAAE